jgi:hypothetical protein
LILEEVKPQPEQHGDRELTIQEWEKEQQRERALAILKVLSSITSPTESESTATPTPTKTAAKSQRHLVRIPDNGKRRGTLA